MIGSAVDRGSLAYLIQTQPPLIESYLSLGQQLQPNGFDLTLRSVSLVSGQGSMGAAPCDRDISTKELLAFPHDGWLELPPGPYLIAFNEIVNLPLDIMALGRPLSSLLRSGVSIHTAVWDAGYRGGTYVAQHVRAAVGVNQQDTPLLDALLNPAQCLLDVPRRGRREMRADDQCRRVGKMRKDVVTGLNSLRRIFIDHCTPSPSGRGGVACRN